MLQLARGLCFSFKSLRIDPIRKSFWSEYFQCHPSLEIDFLCLPNQGGSETADFFDESIIPKIIPRAGVKLSGWIRNQFSGSSDYGHSRDPQSLHRPERHCGFLQSTPQIHLRVVPERQPKFRLRFPPQSLNLLARKE